MLKPLLSAGLLLIFGSSQAALAARPTYNYLGLGYAYQHIDAPNSCAQEGVYLEGSLALNEHFFAGFNHTDVSSNEWCGSTTFRAQGGFKADLGHLSSMYARGSVFARDSGDDTDPGLGIELGIRSILSPSLEANYFVGYDAVDDVAELYLGGGVNYLFTRRLSLLAHLFVTDEDTTGLSLGFRFNM